MNVSQCELDSSFFFFSVNMLFAGLINIKRQKRSFLKELYDRRPQCMLVALNSQYHAHKERSSKLMHPERCCTSLGISKYKSKFTSIKKDFA